MDPTQFKAKPSNYYDCLDQHADPVRRAGWRHALAQATRYEAALAGMTVGDSILDLGCGPGALAGYSSARGRTGSYLGIDSRQGLWQPEDTDFTVGDIFTAPLSRAHIVVAIGTLVDGRPFTSAAERRARALRLIQRGLALATGYFALVVLKQEVLDTRPGLSADPALGGLYRREVLGISQVLRVNACIYDDVLSTDRCIIWSRLALPLPPLATCFAERGTIGPWGANAKPLAIARLWLQAGRRRQAESALAACTKQDAEWRWVRDATQLL